MFWRRTQLIFPDRTAHHDDWTLQGSDGNRLARLYDTQQPDLMGPWRWIVWRNHRMSEGSAHSGAEAKQTCEALLAQSSLMDTKPVN